ncbi:MAG: aquaporin [Ferruginibacter sp.]
MRAMPIKINSTNSGLALMKAAFKKNYPHYVQEAFGLAIFMISACFFAALLEGKNSLVHHSIPHAFIRNIIMGIAMGITALCIFYSPWTAPSGSQINPAVTLAFLRVGKMCQWDALFFVLFQLIGGTLAVCVMQLLMGNLLTNAPVHSVATIPGKYGTAPALITEFIIAFITMLMVLFTSASKQLKSYTRIIAACLVCAWVIIAGPVSGFGMNPARSFASALPSGIWSGFWIYLFIPFAGMLSAAEIFLQWQAFKQKRNGVYDCELQ